MSKDIADMIFAVAFVQEAKAKMAWGDDAENSKWCSRIATQTRDFYLAGLPPKEREDNTIAFLDPEFTEEMSDIWNDALIRTKADAILEIKRVADEYHLTAHTSTHSFSRSSHAESSRVARG